MPRKEKSKFPKNEVELWSDAKHHSRSAEFKSEKEKEKKAENFDNIK